MTVRTILVPLASKLDLASPLNAALAVARPLKAHIDVLYVRKPPASILAEIPEGEITQNLDLAILARETHRTATEAQAKFQNWCEHNGLAHRSKDHLLGTTFARWQEEEQELGVAVAHVGRLADLIVVNHPEPFDMQANECFDAAVFAAGRPTLVAPKSHHDSPLRHVLIAWNSSLQATHAVGFCIDFLHEADTISIFCAPQDDDAQSAGHELETALRWHGIEANLLHSPIGNASVGAALLDAARSVEATLILMGAYTHSRVCEILLGGVTRHILRNATIPVIMTH